MKTKQVLDLLQITRQTLCKYVRNGLIRVNEKPNKRYDYNNEDVYKIAYKGNERKSVIYARVSTSKQKNDLDNQVETISTFMSKNGIKINDIYKDIGSGINFDRKEFQRLLNDVITNKIKAIYITYKDRLSRISFDMFRKLFDNFSCEIIVLNDIDDEKLVEKEIFNEIINLIHCFSKKVYSNRRKEKLKLIEKDLSLEEE